MDANTSHHVLMVAGGQGSRMGAGIPKQFIELCGKPILMHSVSAFTGLFENIQIVIVLPASQITAWQELCERHSFSIPHRVVAGGETRFHSVKNGLSVLPAKGLAAIHDGVRPLVSAQTILSCFRTASEYGSAVPVIPVTDSVREMDGNRNRSLDRSVLRLVQTPQVFDLTLLKEAYNRDYTDAFTDDASVFEKAGHSIHLTEGNAENIKITTRNDLVVAEALMKAGQNHL